MTTPIVTDLPLRLASTTSDSLLGFAPNRAAADVIREFDRRQSEGIDVRLLRNPTDDQVVVAVLDAKTGGEFEPQAEPHRALDVFHHPYAYAASEGPGATTGSPFERVEGSRGRLLPIATLQNFTQEPAMTKQHNIRRLIRSLSFLLGLELAITGGFALALTLNLISKWLCLQLVTAVPT